MAIFRVILHYQDNEISNQLKTVQKDTEVTIHTEDGSYYEASFQGFEEDTDTVNIEIDRFYPNGGKEITVNKKEILSIQTPDGSIDLDQDEVE
ncbi:hypothetical protein [Bacillus kexueae]|uniref:hypothetical protein n=1 Tax=Aeribacillus kexueae TaxID=2078952 RepID=UPI001FAF68B9|nr:hypothetical protein [Bacillus kexueae]